MENVQNQNNWMKHIEMNHIENESLSLEVSPVLSKLMKPNNMTTLSKYLQADVDWVSVSLSQVFKNINHFSYKTYMTISSIFIKPIGFTV